MVLLVVEPLVTTGRRGAILALAFFLAVAAIAPSCAAACCLSQTRAERMMAAMPCCADGGPSVRAQMTSKALPDATLSTAVAVHPVLVSERGELRVAHGAWHAPLVAPLATRNSPLLRI